MNQTDNIINVLSDELAGHKLKSISIKHSPSGGNSSIIKFILNGDNENIERHVGIYGRDLQVSFGKREHITQ